MYIDVVPEEIIWTVNWLHRLNYEAVPFSSSTRHSFVLGTSYVRPYYPTDGVTAFHLLFLSLDCS